jgi:protein-tyrosine-phosphatase
MNVLIVCAGNTCRSPAAAAAVRLAAQRHQIRIDVESAGTKAVPGTPVTETMSRVAAVRGMTLSGSSRQVVCTDLERADIVLALDRSVERALQAMECSKSPDVDLLGSYAPSVVSGEIADPWGGTEDDYASTLDLIVEAAEAFVTSIND